MTKHMINSREDSPFWEVNSFSEAKKFPEFYETRTFITVYQDTIALLCLETYEN